MGKLKVTGNTITNKAKVIDLETNSEIKGIRKVEYVLDVNDIAILKLELVNFELEHENILGNK